VFRLGHSWSILNSNTKLTLNVQATWTIRMLGAQHRSHSCRVFVTTHSSGCTGTAVSWWRSANRLGWQLGAETSHTFVLGKRGKETKNKTQTQKKEMKLTALLAVSWLYGRAGTASLSSTRCSQWAETWNVCKHALNASQVTYGYSFGAGIIF
jgi:hypothetical protein